MDAKVPFTGPLISQQVKSLSATTIQLKLALLLPFNSAQNLIWSVFEWVKSKMGAVTNAFARSLMDSTISQSMILVMYGGPVAISILIIQLLLRLLQMRHQQLTIQQWATVSKNRMIQTHWMKQSFWLMDAWPNGCRLTTSLWTKETSVLKKTRPSVQDKFSYSAPITILQTCKQPALMEVNAHLAGVKNLKDKLLLFTRTLTATGGLAAFVP